MNNNQVIVDITTKEEEEKIRKKFLSNLMWAQSLDDDKLCFLCDGGWYNNTIRGYLIAAARYADFSDSQISELICGLKHAFTVKDKHDADGISDNFI